MLSKFKVLLAALAIVGLGALPLVTSAAASVKLESHLNVANATAGATTYTKTTSAKVDDVVKVELYIHNTELPNSGKVATSVHAKINLPTGQGKVQTLTSSAAATNSNTVTDSATVNLSLDNAALAYIPGSAVWRHNVGTNTNVTYRSDKLSDTIVTTGVNLGDEQPCFNFEQFVTVQMRVIAPVVGIQKTVKVDGTSALFAATNSANPGQMLDYALVIKNYGNTTLKNVVVGDNLPPYLTYVKGSTKLIDSATGIAGKMLADGITTGGVYVDDMAPGASETIYLKATLASAIPAGNHPLRNVGIVKAAGVTEVYNVATTNVNVAATPSPTPTPVVSVCGGLTAAPQGGLDSLNYIFTLVKDTKATGYHFVITDAKGNVVKTLDTTTNSINFAFTTAGTYTVTGQVKTAAGLTRTISGCTVKLTVGSTTPPPTIPDTGASALAGATGLGALGYASRSWIRSRQSLLSTLRRK